MKMEAPMLMNEHLAYLVWGEVATTSIAFRKVEIKIYPERGWVMIPVELRWWARYERFKKLQDYWLRRAHAKVQKFLPGGWRTLVYYQRSSGSGEVNAE